jgi:hypothetical protein
MQERTANKMAKWEQSRFVDMKVISYHHILILLL